MRLIDADRLLMHLSDYALQESPWWGANGYGNKDAYEAIEESIKAVEEAPTVEAVAVVKCKDCKHRPVKVWREEYDEFDVLAPEVDGEEDWRCPCLVEDDPYYSWSPNDDWFCANGERREADGD